MRKKKWVSPFLENEKEYLIFDLHGLRTGLPVYLEIGMGMGDFITESAAMHPEVFYIGLEKEETCVARAIKKAQDRKLNNFRVLLADATNIEEICDSDSIDLIYLHFSDPWPKKRNHKRRLTYPPFLLKYQQILKDGGILILKTDNEGFYDDSLEYFKESSFIQLESDRNYFNESEPMTAYQAKFSAEGKAIYYAKYQINKV
ncbi:MAG: tRNA (guanosine(46)-N7)-methyltransferase TrmB [Erysipelotrichaceae bacterium]|nr:tRNA (guanosine(46)-N7)-methyltransferase TrmB [Erysipelotrichaceae bacterium]